MSHLDFPSVRDAYARWATDYPPEAHTALMRAEEHTMLGALPGTLHGRDLLDVGCGSGRYLAHALRRGVRHAVGVDLSPEMLDRARSALTPHDAHRPRVGLVRGLVEALPFDSARFDVTVCALVLGHVTRLAPALAELARVTRPDGLILCSDLHPIGERLGWKRTFKAGGQSCLVPHTTHRLEEWQDACRDLGLDIVTLAEPGLRPPDVPPARPGHASMDQVPVALVIALQRPGSHERKE